MTRHPDDPETFDPNDELELTSTTVDLTYLLAIPFPEITLPENWQELLNPS